MTDSPDVILLLSSVIPHKKLLLYLFLLFIPLSLVGNKKQFSHLGINDGLSQSWVRTIIQDEFGFTWIGTKDGLNRYDGDSFVVYQPESVNSRGLGNASINSLYIDRQKILWVCTLDGVYRYNRQLDQFEIFEPLEHYSVNCMIQCSESDFWFGTNDELFAYNQNNSQLNRYTHDDNDPESLSSNIIWGLFEDSRNWLWIETQVGLSIYQPESDNFIRPLSGSAAAGLENSQIHQIIEDRPGRLYIASSTGIYRFTPHGDKIHEGSFRKISSSKGYTLLIDQQEDFWIGKGNGQGIEIWPIDEIRLDAICPEQYFPDSQLDGSLSDGSIEVLYEDGAGDIWIGTYGNGFNYYSNHKKPFISTKITTLLEDTNVSNQVNTFYSDEQYLWIGTENGLVRIEPQTSEVKSYHHQQNDSSSLGSNPIYAIEKDRQGHLWVGAWDGGLNKYDPASDQFITYKHEPDDPHSISNNNVFCIFEDSAERLWIGTIGGGLNLFLPKTRTFVRFTHDPDDETSLFSAYINDIAEASDGSLWISAYSALDNFNPDTGTARHYSHTDSLLQQNHGDLEVLFMDSRGQLWLGTEIGLVYFDPTNQFYKKYTVNQGLPNNSIKAIGEDSQGNLWVTTNRGLSQFINGINHPDEPRFFNYDISDGLQGNEFIRRSLYQTTDGDILIGGINGFTRFTPNLIKPDSRVPRILITNLFLINHKVFPDRNSSILKTEPYLAESIILDYDDDIFAFEFSAINYPTSNSIKYAYKLEGFDREWRYVNNAERATYTSIDAGDYVFSVKSTNSDGIWTDNHASLAIRILPPWWKTGLFRIIAGLSTVILLTAIYRYRLYSLHRDQERLTRLVDDRTSELVTANKRLADAQSALECQNRELQAANENLADAKTELSRQNEELLKHRNHLEDLVQERTYELVKARDRAQEADRLKSAFLANMSHEIRTPLNSIMGFSNLIAMQAQGISKFREFSRKIQDSTQLLLQLLNDILDFSKLEAGKIQLQKKELDARKYFDQLCSEFSQMAVSRIPKTVEFQTRCHLPEGLSPVINTDELRLKQILSNFVTNACKFTENGFVRFIISLNKKGDKLNFHLQDTGIGIPREDLSRVFERFQKVADERHSFVQGVGLGLSICRSLANALDLEIQVDSQPGKGSTFTVSIPLEKVSWDHTPGPKAPKAVSLSNTQQEEADWTGKTILVAEDNLDNYAIIELFLSQSGATLIHAIDGIVALRLIKKMTSPPDLLLLDIKMPNMSGDKLLKEIRTLYPDIPAVAQTAYAFSDEKNDILAAGFQDYLIKPIRYEELIATLARHLS